MRSLIPSAKLKSGEAEGVKVAIRKQKNRILVYNTKIVYAEN